MIKSMTGFGRCEIEEDNRKLTVEVKSVNHRYLDVSLRMPKKLNSFESAIRQYIKKYAARGKIDIFISFVDYSEGENVLRYNEPLAKEYLNYLGKMSETFGLDNDIRVSTLSRYPDVLVMEEKPMDDEAVWNLLEKCLKGALVQLKETRMSEGENLKKDILEKLDNILNGVAYIKERSPEIVSEYRAKLEDKVKELLGDNQIDENRLAAEVIIYADKICTDEEVVRLTSHVEHMRKTLDGSDDIGRKLDFIAQEMNREANTILSKANDIKVSDCAINLKTEIEKVREQIQNIE